MRTAKESRRRPKTADYRVRAAVAHALGNANRLMILDALSERDRCVNELVGKLGCDQSTVSKHLAVLKNAGIIDDRREGARVYYRLACECVGRFFDCIEEVIAARLDRQRQLLAAPGRFRR
jgi:ArsR family transcriptional regulator